LKLALIGLSFGARVELWALDGGIAVKKYLIGIFAFALTSVAAFAAANAAELLGEVADGYRPKPLDPVWGGFYAGWHFGLADAQDSVKDIDGLNHRASFSVSDTAFIGGGQAGYNWQGSGRLSRLVVGVEADIGDLALRGKSFDPRSSGVTYSGFDSGLYGDVTGRVGVALSKGLLYGKAGFAFFNGDVFVDNTAGSFGGGRASAPDSFTGWTAGGGFEFFVTPSWTIKGEYLHFDFGSQNAVLHTPKDGDFRYSNSLTADTFTLGVNYHVGSHYTPLK
jgi:outer membrane immunogenic protein